MSLTKAWVKKKREHLVDYRDSLQCDIRRAFKAGWMAHINHLESNNKKYDEVRRKNENTRIVLWNKEHK